MTTSIDPAGYNDYNRPPWTLQETIVNEIVKDLKFLVAMSSAERTMKNRCSDSYVITCHNLRDVRLVQKYVKERNASKRDSKNYNVNGLTCRVKGRIGKKNPNRSKYYRAKWYSNVKSFDYQYIRMEDAARYDIYVDAFKR